jgi:LuxR family maltose regulon positive regulatory protein
LYIPPSRSELVPRIQLLGRLNGGLKRRLTLICAPAGFGKTTLLSEWVNGKDEGGRRRDEAKNLHPLSFTPNLSGPHPFEVAWFSLDENDNDLSRFLSYLVAALQTVRPDVGKTTAAMLQSPQSPPLETMLTAFINDITHLSDKVVLVLDDYHVIANKIIHDALTFLLEHQPPQLHLVLSTRADPPLPIFRLRARNQLTELRDSDLRFSADEAAIFLNEIMALDLLPADIAALEACTEGWIVGLQLAALSMQGRADKHKFVTAFTGSHHYILEYLTEEVVHQQPESIRQFLIQTSILSRLSGPLCDAVCQADMGASDTILANLRRDNLFVIPLDDECRWYRYHHLFADLLGNLRRKHVSEEQIGELHRRASVWYEQNGSVDEAVNHALQAEDFERAAALIEQAAPATMLHGRLTTLLRWLDVLPDELLHSRPRIIVYKGWALFLSGQVDIAERMLQDTRKVLPTLPPSADNEALRGELATLLTTIATMQGDTVRIKQEAEEALAHLPEDALISRARANVALGYAQMYDDDLETANQTWHIASDLAVKAGNLFLAASAIEMVAAVQAYHQGLLRQAAQTIQQIIDWGTRQDAPPLPFTAGAHCGLASIYLEWNELDTADRYLDKGLALSRQAGIGYHLAPAYCTQARLRQAWGDREGVLESLQMAEQFINAHPAWTLIIHQTWYQVQSRLWLGDVETAARWAEGDPAIIKHEIPNNLPVFLQEIREILLARVALARGEIEKALEILSRLGPQAESAGRMVRVIEIGLLRALAWQAQGNIDDAMASLERPLVLAQPERYIRLFVDQGEPMAQLLREAVSRGIASNCARKLLAAFGDSSADEQQIEQKVISPAVLQHLSMVEPLTRREIDILQLICAGYSNQEIAERLSVTLNTVKKHTSHIYGKLDVKSRTQAIARAQEIGLL